MGARQFRSGKIHHIGERRAIGGANNIIRDLNDESGHV